MSMLIAITEPVSLVGRGRHSDCDGVGMRAVTTWPRCLVVLNVEPRRVDSCQSRAMANFFNVPCLARDCRIEVSAVTRGMAEQSTIVTSQLLEYHARITLCQMTISTFSG
jgi:hypothetical protein